MPFRPKPYDPEREGKRSPAQKAATMRNFRVFQLHGLAAQCRLLTGKRRERAKKLVDDELRAMGARTVTEAAEERRRKWSF